MNLSGATLVAYVDFESTDKRFIFVGDTHDSVEGVCDSTNPMTRTIVEEMRSVQDDNVHILIEGDYAWSLERKTDPTCRPFATIAMYLTPSIHYGLHNQHDRLKNKVHWIDIRTRLSLHCLHQSIYETLSESKDIPDDHMRIKMHAKIADIPMYYLSKCVEFFNGGTIPTDTVSIVFILRPLLDEMAKLDEEMREIIRTYVAEEAEKFYNLCLIYPELNTTTYKDFVKQITLFEACLQDAYTVAKLMGPGIKKAIVHVGGLHIVWMLRMLEPRGLQIRELKATSLFLDNGTVSPVPSSPTQEGAARGDPAPANSPINDPARGRCIEGIPRFRDFLYP
jgi:hypothetical protein